MLTSVLLTKLPPENRLIMTGNALSDSLDLQTLKKVLGGIAFYQSAFL